MKDFSGALEVYEDDYSALTVARFDFDGDGIANSLDKTPYCGTCDNGAP